MDQNPIPVLSGELTMDLTRCSTNVVPRIRVSSTRKLREGGTAAGRRKSSVCSIVLSRVSAAVSPTTNRTEATTRSRMDRPATIRTPTCTRPGGCAVCFLRPLVTGPFVEKSSGAKFRVFFGHDKPNIHRKYFEARLLVCSFTTIGYAVYLRHSSLIGERSLCPRTLAPVSVVNDVSRHQPLELRVSRPRLLSNNPLL